LKDKLQQSIDSEIEKITGDNKEAQDILKKIVAEIFDNLNNPKQMMELLQDTISNELVIQLKGVLTK